jgi:hypothetical protein
VPATLTPKPGVDLAKATVVGQAVTYSWHYTRPAGYPATPGPLRWRLYGVTYGVAGSPSDAQCHGLAVTHKAWTGPSAG